METYNVKVEIDIQIELPKITGNPEFEIEKLLNEMADKREDSVCSIMEIKHEIICTDTSAKLECHKKSFII